jgi:protocatechuate 3,4-dioxygenase beta subunit
VYGGVIANGNGVGSKNPSNAYNTMLRGLQHTDSEGVAQSTTVFLGHYTGHAVYIHVIAHLNASVFSNKTWGFGITWELL